MITVILGVPAALLQFPWRTKFAQQAYSKNYGQACWAEVVRRQGVSDVDEICIFEILMSHEKLFEIFITQPNQMKSFLEVVTPTVISFWQISFTLERFLTQIVCHVPSY